jgi:hypothetical protein
MHSKSPMPIFLLFSNAFPYQKYNFCIFMQWIRDTDQALLKGMINGIMDVWRMMFPGSGYGLFKR